MTMYVCTTKSGFKVNGIAHCLCGVKVNLVRLPPSNRGHGSGETYGARVTRAERRYYPSGYWFYLTYEDLLANFEVADV